MQLKSEPWGSYDGIPCLKFTITDSNSGSFVTATNLGAALLRIVRRDKNGNLVDIALTQETPEELIGSRASFGATVGRVANRIDRGRFELDGTTYDKLPINNEPHHLHGGIDGFYKKVWEVTEQEQKGNEVRLGFKYKSEDKEQGYPGTLIAAIVYHFEPNKIWWESEATTDKATIVNLTNHTYWNLQGLDVTIDEQEIEVPADTYLPIDKHGLPTGEVRPVELDNLDMRSRRKFSDIFEKFVGINDDGDVDNNFFLNEAKAHEGKNQHQLHHCATVSSAKTGISMVIHTSEPCVQLYTGNSLGEVGTCNGGHKAEKHFSFSLETQKPPNAINNPNYKDLVILRPEGDKYYHKTVHEFHVAN